MLYVSQGKVPLGVSPKLQFISSSSRPLWPSIPRALGQIRHHGLLCFITHTCFCFSNCFLVTHLIIYSCPLPFKKTGGQYLSHFPSLLSLSLPVSLSLSLIFCLWFDSFLLFFPSFLHCSWVVWDKDIVWGKDKVRGMFWKGKSGWGVWNRWVSLGDPVCVCWTHSPWLDSGPGLQEHENWAPEGPVEFHLRLHRHWTLKRSLPVLLCDHSHHSSGPAHAPRPGPALTHALSGVLGLVQRHWPARKGKEDCAGAMAWPLQHRGLPCHFCEML